MDSNTKKVTPIRRYSEGVLIHETEAVEFGPVFEPNVLLVNWWSRWEAGTNRPVPETLKVVARPGSGKTRGGM